MNSIINRKLRHFGHVKRDSDLGGIVMEGVVPGNKGRGDQCEGEHRTLKAF